MYLYVYLHIHRGTNIYIHISMHKSSGVNNESNIVMNQDEHHIVSTSFSMVVFVRDVTTFIEHELMYLLQ